jgi:DNA invertase Pin-like site-specific DNA recombinase
MGRLTLQIMGAFAEFERSIIRERMENGRKAAEKRGTLCNRKRKDIPKTKVLNLVEKQLSANAIAKIMEVDVGTIVNRLSEWGYIYENGKWIMKVRSEYKGD